MKYPILYNYATDDLNTMGLGQLKGIETITIQRDANAFPILNMTYDKDDVLAKELKVGMIIKTSMGAKPEEQNQLFRITEVGGDDLGAISVTGNHIAADLAYNVINKDISIANADAQTAFNSLKEALADPNPALSFSTDISKVANLAWNLKDANPVSTYFVQADDVGDVPINSMQALYNGNWLFNNYHMSLMQQGGTNTGIVIKYGRRLKTLTQDTNIDSTYNAIFPFATYSPTEVPVDGDGSQDFDGQGVVQYVGAGGASTYNTPFKGHTVNGHVQNGTYYKVLKVASDNTVNGDTWYEIAEGQWIDQHFFTFDKSGTYVVNKVDGQGTVSIDDNSDDQGIIVAYSGVGTIQYSGLGGVALWTSPFGGKVSGQYLKNGTSWKITAKAVDRAGRTWYCLGNQSTQWVSSQYFSLQKTGDYATTRVDGIVSVSGSPTMMTRPGTGIKVTWKPAKGSKWRVNSIATDSAGETWYCLGTNQWVKSDENIEFKSVGTVDVDSEGANKALAKATGKVPVYSEPTYNSKPTGRVINVGQQLVISAQADNNGTTWYEIGTNEWVDASYFSFSKNTDVTPGNSDDANKDVEVEDVTVTLSENNGILLAPTAIGKEAKRVLAVDLSEYNVRDEDKLKEVALAYMREYRFGYPNVSLTLGYQDINGEVDLYDTVSIQFDQLGIAETAQVNSVTWNVLTEHYDSITIGELPITYEHALGNYIDNKVTKQTSAVEKKATHLFGEMHNAVKLEGDDRKAAMIKIAQELNLAKQTYTEDYAKLDQAITNINGEIDSIQHFIEGGSNAPIQAFPNWQNPTELRAVNGDGSYMRFNSNGLEYVGAGDHILRSAIDGQGNVIAESITGGKITGVTLEGVNITGSSVIHSGDREHGDPYATVMSGRFGISISGDNGSASMSSYELRLPQDFKIWIGNSYFFYAPNGFKGSGVYIHQSDGDHYVG